MKNRKTFSGFNKTYLNLFIVSIIAGLVAKALMYFLGNVGMFITLIVILSMFTLSRYGKKSKDVYFGLGVSMLTVMVVTLILTY